MSADWTAENAVFNLQLQGACKRGRANFLNALSLSLSFWFKAEKIFRAVLVFTPSVSAATAKFCFTAVDGSYIQICQIEIFLFWEAKAILIFIILA